MGRYRNIWEGMENMTRHGLVWERRGKVWEGMRSYVKVWEDMRSYWKV